VPRTWQRPRLRVKALQQGSLRLKQCNGFNSRARALAPSPPLSWRLDIKFASEEKTKILEGQGGGVGGEMGGGRDEEQVDGTSSQGQGWSLDMWGGER
jgi:hypothetical protein